MKQHSRKNTNEVFFVEAIVIFVETIVIFVEAILILPSPKGLLPNQELRVPHAASRSSRIHNSPLVFRNLLFNLRCIHSILCKSARGMTHCTDTQSCEIERIWYCVRDYGSSSGLMWIDCSDDSVVLACALCCNTSMDYSNLRLFDRLLRRSCCTRVHSMLQRIDGLLERS